MRPGKFHKPFLILQNLLQRKTVILKQALVLMRRFIQRIYQHSVFTRRQLKTLIPICGQCTNFVQPI